jgi:ferric-dicitrate binding protein FerR (iron transport regulator)
MTEDNEHSDVRRLLEAAGKRENPPNEMRNRVHDEVLRAWDEMPERDTDVSRPTRLRDFAAVASIVLAFVVGVVFLRTEPHSPEQWAARIADTTGEYGVSQRRSDGQLPNDALLATKDDGRMILEMGGGGEVRIDVDTRISVLSMDSIALFDGRIYVDGGPDETSDIRVMTPHSVITDIGTLFAVSVDGDRMTVAMREGAVEVETGDQLHRASAREGRGDQLEFSGDRLAAQSTLSTTGSQWDWTASLVRPFDLSGASVYEYLQWAARDSGKTLIVSSIVELQAKQDVFGGAEISAGSRTAEIESALRSTRFQRLESEDHELVVDFAD